MICFWDVFWVLALLRHSYTDLRELLLYDWLTALLAAVGLLRLLCAPTALVGLEQGLLGAAVLLALMLVLYFASRGGLGEGDVKLAPVLGLWLGLEQGLLALLFAFVSGGAVGVLLLACGWGRRRALPFGPFLCAGALVAYFYGQQLLQWYWRFF